MSYVALLCDNDEKSNLLAVSVINAGHSEEAVS